MQDIVIHGAKEHNLKNISVTFQRYKMIVVTGMSGSGKSSLVMDTLYAEGQRRFVESLSAYARQFLGLMEKPDVEEITGLSPVIAIDQKSTSKNPRSTVGTITEIYDYLRLLFARIGTPFCPHCEVPISKQSISQIIQNILTDYTGQKIQILAPMIKGVKGEHKEFLKDIQLKGFLRARINGTIQRLDQPIELERYKTHTIEVVVDRLKVDESSKNRLSDSIETACRLGKGLMIVLSETQEKTYSENFACISCGYSFKEISPRLFSFNSPYGACDGCDGLGTQPVNPAHLKRLMFRYQKTQSFGVKEKIEEAMSAQVCQKCHGSRLNQEALSIKIYKHNIADICNLPADKLLTFFKQLKLSKQESIIAEKIVKEIKARTQFLLDVGLDYLTLSRTSKTLSGGEAQRIRLATQIGSGLVNVLYILDEPSIGLHQRDNERLLDTLENLCKIGNTLVIIEHDEDTMKRADQIVDLGPEAGVHGGEVIFSGTYEEILKCPNSLTGRYLRGERFIAVPPTRRPGNGQTITVKQAYLNNLKNIDVTFPLGKFICVTGVSGSGKSSLVNDVLYETLRKSVGKKKAQFVGCSTIEGLKDIDKVIVIDQSPIGRSPRSNPATYTGVFDTIREIFSKLPNAQIRGYSPGRFSFNMKGGRCEACEGKGFLKIEMHFMPDVYVPCDECEGKRFNRETLAITLKDKNIADVLNMTVRQAMDFFANYYPIKHKLEALVGVGLGYITLGQSATTLSGGEAQRIKLSRELGKRASGNTLYILDEPTTGLHFADIEKLLIVLQGLVDKGNTLVVIEHNLDVIKTCDHIIDLGPEGGEKGGTILAEGTPETIAKTAKSYTGKYLKPYLS